MDPSSSKGSKKYSFFPVKSCDMGFPEGVLTKSKSKSVTPKPVKYAIPVRLCDMDWDVMKPQSVRKQLWSPLKENKNVTKVQKNNLSVPAKTKKGFNFDETLPLIDSENYDNNPNLFKKPINQINQKPKTTKHSRPSTARSKKISGPTIVSQIINTEEYSSNKKEKNLSKRVISSEKVSAIATKSTLPVQPILDEQRLIEIFDKKINDITNKLEFKYNQIIERLDKLEMEKNTECIMCCKKTFSSTSSSSYAINDFNSSCFIVETDKSEKTSLDSEKEQLVTVDTPEVNDMINDALLKIDENLKPKKLFDDESKPSKEVTIDSNDENELLKSPESKLNNFELLEARLENSSPQSWEVNLSDTDSPALKKEDMAWLLNENKDRIITKFVSTPSIVPAKKKTVKFLSKSYHDLSTDSFGMYNEIRDNVKFLCTPKNTKTLSNLMTPSIENSQKKLISRRVQKQLLMLN